MQKKESTMKRAAVLILVFLLVGCVKTPEPIPNTPPVISDDSAIGFIGCSNTGQTVNGYYAAGGERIWAVDKSVAINQGTYPPFGGGTVNKWSETLDNNIYWDIFDEYLALHPDTKTVWWQLCIKQTDVFTYDTAHIVLEEIRERIPGVTVYVSPLPPFTDHTCSITGKTGFERMNGLAEELAEKEDDVSLAPVLPGLVRSENVQDGCHMTPAGSKKVGTALKEFFDD